MFKHLLFLTATLGWLPAQAATVYKCTGEDGKVVFSDRECGVSAETIEYKHPESYTERIARELAEAKARRADQEAELNRARELRARESAERDKRHRDFCSARLAQEGLIIGMSKADLYKTRLWNFPDEVSKTTTAHGVTEYWVYKCDGYGSVRLFLRNGKLDSIHN